MQKQEITNLPLGSWEDRKTAPRTDKRNSESVSNWKTFPEGQHG